MAIKGKEVRLLSKCDPVLAWMVSRKKSTTKEFIHTAIKKLLRKLPEVEDRRSKVYLAAKASDQFLKNRTWIHLWAERLLTKFPSPTKRGFYKKRIRRKKACTTNTAFRSSTILLKILCKLDYSTKIHSWIIVYRKVLQNRSSMRRLSLTTRVILPTVHSIFSPFSCANLRLKGLMRHKRSLFRLWLTSIW